MFGRKSEKQKVDSNKKNFAISASVYGYVVRPKMKLDALDELSLKQRLAQAHLSMVNE